jgi:predicted Zn-dependent peptidase
MSVAVDTLANGFRVVTQRMPHLETVSLGVWVACGSRHERLEEHGISHFLEHMAFKGTASRSARDIAEEIENVGGEINAATGLEQTAYYARVLKGDEGLALDVIADILLHPRLAPEDIAVEQEVVLQEIAATRDVPDEIAYDMLEAMAFPDQPLGRPILGTVESVGRFDAGRIADFLARHYRPDRMVMSAAGAVDHAALLARCEALFGAVPAGETPPVEAGRYVGGTAVEVNEFEQSHLILAFHGLAIRDRELMTLQVLSGLLGGGASSRLFQEVREKRGLCYSIYSFVSAFEDEGMFGVHAATGPDEVGKLLPVVADEIANLASRGPSQTEVARAKAQLKAGLLMSLESSGARAEQLARQLQVHGRVLPLEEIIGLVDAVTAEAVRATAGRLLEGGRPTFVEVGRKASAKHFDDVAKRLATAVEA